MADTNIDLEKIVKEGTSFLINKQADEEPDLTKKIPYWMGTYATNELGEKVLESAHELLRTKPLAVGDLIREYKGKHQERLINEVKKNPQSVIENLDPNSATNMAAPYLMTNEDRALSEVINNNGDIRSSYANLDDTELWRSIVAMADIEDIKRAATSYISGATQPEIMKNLFDEKGYNPSKAADFLYKQIDKMEEGEQNSFYSNIGMTYTQTQLQKAQAEAQEKAA